jgi:hypothetical protein
VIQPVESKFKKYITQIDMEVRKLEDLKNIAHEAQAIDIHEVVTQTGKGMSVSVTMSGKDILTYPSGGKHV